MPVDLPLLYICPIESFYDTFHTMADMMYFCQMLAVVETINAAIGVTSSPVVPCLIQVLNSKAQGWGMTDLSVYLVGMPQFTKKS